MAGFPVLIEQGDFPGYRSPTENSPFTM